MPFTRLLGGFRHLHAVRAEEPDHVLVEGMEVLRAAAGDEAVVFDAGLVDPSSAGVAEVGLERGPGGEGAAADDVGFDEHPGAVTDGRDGTACIEEGPD